MQGEVAQREAAKSTAQRTGMHSVGTLSPQLVERHLQLLSISEATEPVPCASEIYLFFKSYHPPFLFLSYPLVAAT